MLFRIPPRPLAVALAIFLLGGLLTARAETSGEAVVVEPGHQITPAMEALISSSAVKVLRHIAQARGMLNSSQPEIKEAEDELARADKLLGVIHDSLPTTKVKDQIWVASKHLDYENSKEVLPDLVPIYASLTELVDYVPTDKAKQHLDKARQALQKGLKQQARDQLKEADDALLYVEADLPLNATGRLVNAARQALADGDTKLANSALTSAEDNVVFISLSLHSPLIQAKAAIARGWVDYNLGHMQSAHKDLADVVGYLQQAAGSSDEVTRKDAADLVADVRGLQQLMATDDQDFEQRLTGAWQRVKALSERTAELVSTGWDRLRTGDKMKRQLVEAKLQVAYARVDHLIMHDDAAARIDLGEAAGYVDAARAKADGELEEQLRTLSTQLGDLASDIDADRHNGASRFYAVERTLSHMISAL